MTQFRIGDFVEAYDPLGREVVQGYIIWIQSQSERVFIKGCGTLFRPEKVKRLWFDVDVTDLL